ncbi:hypothetical protein DB88DRAFT_538238 [Papiliotrema laurentii]|uniref:Uncharacterized protein n=1 Tax=Papiliotrema laurentii TaxID=5418 RepID=A0AAD9L8I9_PAPLA|nr:hypothetical protein DB88DRAFT_538238 [Papiliotrema laurentii]
MPPRPQLSVLDYAHRAFVWGCVGLTAYGCLLTAHGFTVRFLRRQNPIPLPIDQIPTESSPFQPDEPQISQRPS